MGQQKIVGSSVLKGLEVSGLDGEEFLQLPETYIQDEIPVTKEPVITDDMIKKWPYLKEVHIPHIDADIGLLIRMNAPKLLEPRQVINSQGDVPYAVRTVLGWVVNGLLDNPSNEKNQVILCQLHFSI